MSILDDYEEIDMNSHDSMETFVPKPTQKPKKIYLKDFRKPFEEIEKLLNKISPSKSSQFLFANNTKTKKANNKVAERLYSKQQLVDHRINILRREYSNKKMQECTFFPKINKRKSGKRRSIKRFLHDQCEYESDKQYHLFIARGKITANNKENVINLSPGTVKILKKRETKLPVYNRLFNASKFREIPRKKADSECVFSPMIISKNKNKNFKDFFVE